MLRSGLLWPIAGSSISWSWRLFETLGLSCSIIYLTCIINILGVGYLAKNILSLSIESTTIPNLNYDLFMWSNSSNQPSHLVGHIILLFCSHSTDLLLIHFFQSLVTMFNSTTVIVIPFAHSCIHIEISTRMDYQPTAALIPIWIKRTHFRIAGERIFTTTIFLTCSCAHFFSGREILMWPAGSSIC